MLFLIFCGTCWIYVNVEQSGPESKVQVEKKGASDGWGRCVPNVCAGCPKSAGRKVILGALQLVFSGGIYIPPQALSRPGPPPAPASSPPPQTAPAGDAAGRPPASPADLGVTERQLDVLALMMQGKSNKAICRMLNLAEPTVKNHVRAILKALKVANRTEAVIAVGALQWELPSIAKS